MPAMPEITALTLPERVDPSKTAVIVVDVQNDFCHSDSPLTKVGMDTTAAQEMVPNLLQLIDAARAAGTTIIWVKMVQTNYFQSIAAPSP